MDLLTEPLETFTYDKVVAFCGERFREGLQLDYKEDLPGSGLSKQIASFANTRGGVLVIGVTEDRRTGIPSAWNGILDSAKSVEKIYQWISNVTPIPPHDLHVTDARNGRVFILVRVDEGPQSPYYVQNDANIWVRTGNISTPVDIASPEVVELLIGKKEKAQLARNNYHGMATMVYDSAFSAAEVERQRLVKQDILEYEEKQRSNPVAAINDGPYVPRYYSKPLGVEAAICKFSIQPFYPSKALMRPSELRDNLAQLRGSLPYIEFPNLSMRPIPEGLYFFDWDKNNGRIECHQVYATGLVYFAYDILTVDTKEDKRIFSTKSICSILFRGLEAASNYYRNSHYRGGVNGSLNLSGVRSASVEALGDSWYRSAAWGVNSALLDEYEWDLSLDSTILLDPVRKARYFIQKSLEIEWDLGYPDASEELTKQYMRANHWLPESM